MLPYSSSLQKPDYITVGGSSNKKLEPIDGATDDPGTFTFDDESKKLSHLITGKGIDTTKELPMDLKVYKCFYENCTDPHPKPLPANPTLLQRPETVGAEAVCLCGSPQFLSLFFLYFFTKTSLPATSKFLPVDLLES